ncbi:MAG: metallophosphoesterase [Phycisphaerales bacterium]|nr:metallophosphoesterase [Phycisphaerales bacterium]
MLRTLGLALSTILCCAGAALGQASLGPSGYSENFDSMGTTGTAAPLGWRHFATSFGSNSTWTTSIPASGTNSMASIGVTTAASTLTATSAPTGNSNGGYNAARAAAATSDRVIATAPTTVAGTIIQLQLSNDTGAALPAGSVVTIAFDTVRFLAVSSANELPGHWLFVSENGTTWANVSPNPTITTVPNTVGITTSTLSHTLAASWNTGTSIYLRWVDDNAVATSPDQIVGLNNVVISAVGADPNGRCCFADGSCAPTITGTCTGGSFTPQGVCSPNTCPQPAQGSCCVADGSCTVSIQAACAATWTTGGTCTPNTCPVLVASITPAGYAENFDALGTSGTALPTGFSMWSVTGDRPTFEEIANGGTGVINLSAVPTATIVSPPGFLAVYNQAATATPGTRNAGYNFGFSADPSDRLLGVSPTGNGASFIQLRLRNDSGAPLSTLTVSYTFRIMSPWTANELAGYRFFYSLSGPNGTYFAVPTLDGVATSSDSTGASILESATIVLASPLAAGAEIVIRWGDDNGNASPDQAYAIDNLTVLGVDPSNLGACCAASGSCSPALNAAGCNGSFLGVGTLCTPNPCPQPPQGSCCLADGSCTITTQIACTNLWTVGGVCVPNTCPGPTAACCAADGSCTIVPVNTCIGFSIAGASCSPVLCRQPGATRFCAFGDYGVDNANQLSVANRMKSFNPEFLVTTGDNTYNTSTAVSNYDNTQAKYYGEFIRVANPASVYFAQFGSNTNNFFPCMGNHDFDIGGGAAGAIPYWNAYWDLPGNERYYTFSRGPIQFFVLSSDSREPDSDLINGIQYNWFINAYNASTATFKIVVFHHPPYTNPTVHGNDAQMQAWNFQNLPGITAVLNGHNHNMQRLEVNGVPFFISGAGGNSLYTISGSSPFNAFNNDSLFGFLLVDATPAACTFRFISAAGNVLDTRVVNATTGACCTGTTCAIATSAACSGSFRGVGSACGPVGNPTTCCIANYNQIDGVNFQDIFDFLNAWFANAPSTDINSSGAVDFQDIFDYLNAWFAGC